MYPPLLRVSLEPKLSAPVFEVPHQLLLLGIHRDDRLTLPQEASDLAVDMLKLSIAIRMRRAFQSLGVCLQAIAQLMQQLGNQTVADAVTPTAPNSWASLRTLLQVQRSGDSGSPRLSGSINRSKSLTSVASCSTVRLRPPPGLRIAPPEGTGGLPNSTIPRAIARLDNPLARAKMEIPP